jgi:hypothetical protein
LEDDWKYEPSGFGESCDGLQSLYEKYTNELDDDEFNTEFGDFLYSRFLEVMNQSVAAGEFGAIWLRYLSLSDDEHPVVDQSIDMLNDEQGKAIARLLI